MRINPRPGRGTPRAIVNVDVFAHPQGRTVLSCPAETYQPARLSSSGRGQPASDPADLLRPSRASAAAAVGVEEEVEGLGQVAKAVDPGDPDLVACELSSSGLGITAPETARVSACKRQLVLGPMAAPGSAPPCGAACPTGGPGRPRGAGSAPRR